jgi:hypothetical protein
MENKMKRCIPVAICVLCVSFSLHARAAVYVEHIFNVSSTSNFYGTGGNSLDTFGAALHSSYDHPSGTSTWFVVYVSGYDGMSDSTANTLFVCNAGMSCVDSEWAFVNGMSGENTPVRYTTTTFGYYAEFEVEPAAQWSSGYYLIPGFTCGNSTCDPAQDPYSVTSLGGGYFSVPNMWYCIADTPEECENYSSPTTPIMSFLWPTEGTTTVGFTQALLVFYNLTSTDQYQVGLDHIWPQVAENHSNSEVDSGASLMAFGLPVKITPFHLWSAATSADVIAQATLYDVTNFRIPLNLDNFAVASASVEWTQLLYNGTNQPEWLNPKLCGYVIGTWCYTLPTTTPPIVQPPLITSSTFGLQCVLPTSTGLGAVGADLSFAGCSVLNWLFVPTQDSTAQVISGFDDMQRVFPFNMVYGTLNIISDAAQNAPTTASGTLALSIFGTPITVLSGNTLESFVGTANKNMIFETEDAFAWASVAWTIVKVIF